MAYFSTLKLSILGLIDLHLRISLDLLIPHITVELLAGDKRAARRMRRRASPVPGLEVQASRRRARGARVRRLRTR